ncbi:hypothetical protein D3C81_892080 [compost metagenome]
MTCTTRSTAPRASSPVALAMTPWGARPGNTPRCCRRTSCRKCTTLASIPRCWWSMPTTRSTAVISTTRRVNWCARWTSCVARSSTNTKRTGSCVAAILDHWWAAKSFATTQHPTVWTSTRGSSTRSRTTGSNSGGIRSTATIRGAT